MTYVVGTAENNKNWEWVDRKNRLFENIYVWWKILSVHTKFNSRSTKV